MAAPLSVSGDGPTPDAAGQARHGASGVLIYRVALTLILIGLLIWSFIEQMRLTAQPGPIQISIFLWLPGIGLLAGALLDLAPEQAPAAQRWPIAPAAARMPPAHHVLAGAAMLCAALSAYLVRTNGSAAAATATWGGAVALALISACDPRCWAGIRARTSRFGRAGWRWPRWPVAALAAILVLGAALRVPALDSIPGFLHNDEGNCGLTARAIADGQVPSIFSYGFMGLPMLGYAWDASFLKLFGDSLTSLRLSSAVLGLATIAVTCLLGKELFNWRAGLIAAAVLTFAHLDIHFSRDGLHNIQAPFAVTTTLYLLVYALRHGSRLAAVGAGVLLSVDLQVFFSARLAFAIVPLCGIYILLISDRQLFPRRLPTIGWMILGLIAAGVPIGAFITEDLGGFLSHTSDSSVFSHDPSTLAHMRSGYGTTDIGYVMRTNIWTALQTFNFPGHVADQYPFMPHPMLDPVSGALLPGALAYALFRPRRTGFGVCLIAFVTIMVGIGMLTLDQPDWNRLLIILPFVALLIGAFLDGIAHLLDGVPRLAIPAALALAATLACIGYGNYRWYFAEFQPAISHDYAALPMDIGRYLRGLPGHPYAYAVTAGDDWMNYQSVQFLAPNAYGCNLMQGLDTSACPAEPARERLFFVAPQRASLIPALERAFPGGTLSVFHTYAGDLRVMLYRTGSA